MLPKANSDQQNHRNTGVWKGPVETTHSNPSGQSRVSYSILLRTTSSWVLNSLWWWRIHNLFKQPVVRVFNHFPQYWCGFCFVGGGLVVCFGFFVVVFCCVFLPSPPPLTFKINFLYFNFCLVPLVLSLGTAKKTSVFFTSPHHIFIYNSRILLSLHCSSLNSPSSLKSLLIWQMVKSTTFVGGHFPVCPCPSCTSFTLLVMLS